MIRCHKVNPGSARVRAGAVPEHGHSGTSCWLRGGTDKGFLPVPKLRPSQGRVESQATLLFETCHMKFIALFSPCWWQPRPKGASQGKEGVTDQSLKG